MKNLATPPTKRFKTSPDFASVSAWIAQLIGARQADTEHAFEELLAHFPAPALPEDSALGGFIKENELSPEAVFTLLFLFAYTQNPRIISPLIHDNNPCALRPIEGLFAPTGYTILYLLQGVNPGDPRKVFNLFRPAHPFNRRSILQLMSPPPGLGEYAGVLQFVPGIFDMFITNTFQAPRFGDNFPAKLLHTDQVYEDMIHEDYLLRKMKIVVNQYLFEQKMRDELGMDKQMPRGYRVLMSGPPGTGKSMAAAVMGRYMYRDVYQVMLSQVLNKYIGESEKNLERLFDMAEGKGWVLFFDEADALFGNRSEEGKDDAGSRNRNELISYLLQRLERYDGMVLAATNLENNMDVAFKRRFQEHLRFSLPGEHLRARIWEKYLPKNYKLDERIRLQDLAKHILPPSSIANVCNRTTLYSLFYDHKMLKYDDLSFEIKVEMQTLGIA